jgi:anti-anti-sigma factor
VILGSQRFESALELHENTTPNTGTLILSGELTIQDAKALKKVVLDALLKTDICLLDLKTVSQYDLASLQILYAAYKSSKEQNKTLALAGKCPNTFSKAVTEAGFDSFQWLGFGEGN